MKKVAVVICNYNKVDMVMQCIACIMENKFTDYDLIVVDNASTDGAPERIRGEYGDRLTLLVNEENLGGSGGFNTGLRHAFERGYEYYMCVDNDAMLDEEAIGNLYQFMEEHPEVGMAASKIYHLENPDYIQQFGQKIDFEYFCTEVPHVNMLEDGSMPDFLYVDSVAACSLMVRRETIEEIGFLPEENFLYWDDTEWCYLCNRSGRKVASVGASKALHAMGAKKEAVNTFPTYYAWRNWISFFWKYTPKEKREKMATTFLKSIFQMIYADVHKGERRVSQTIMMAYDDAIHGVTGKAGPNRIFDIDRNLQPYIDLFSSGARFCMEENSFPLMAERIRQLAKALAVEQRIAPIVWEQTPGLGVVTVSLCESIFRVEDMSLQKVYIDLEDCILRTEDDLMDVINYNYSERSFVFAQLPVFLESMSKHGEEE